MQNRTKQALLKIASAIIAVLAIGIIHEMGRQDEILIQQHACQMVNDGAWPAHYCPE